MQTLSRLSRRNHCQVHVVAAWLAIAAIMGALPGPAFARTSCAPRGASASACTACHRAEAAPEAGSASCALAKKPCCGCEITSDPLPAAAAGGLQLDRPASQWHGLAVMGPTRIGAIAPPSASRLHAPGSPDLPPDRAGFSTILRL
jgi:hypothetical protein